MPLFQSGSPQPIQQAVKPGGSTSSAPVYLAEFALETTDTLVGDLLIQSPSAAKAKRFAQRFAHNWGIRLFAITPVTPQQAQFYRESFKFEEVFEKINAA